MIITALDTGMRRGEMLALRFADLESARGLITLRGETTKSKEAPGADLDAAAARGSRMAAH